MDDFAYIKSVSITIPAGGSLSPALKLEEGHGIVRIVMPDAWDTANLSFQFAGIANPGTQNAAAGTFKNYYDSDGGEIIVSAGAGRDIALPPRLFGTGFFYVKVRSGTNGTPVNQSVDRTLTLITRPF